jgi:phosphatidylglycerophosphate synthase
MTQLPNLISAARLGAMPFLLAAAMGHHPRAFAWLLLICLVSDIVDGLIARHFHVQSTLGAALDSLADFLMTLVAVVGMIVLQPAFTSAHGLELCVLGGLYITEVVAAFARYGRLSSFHTYATRVSAYAQGIFFVGLFFWGETTWLFYLAWTLACAAYLEELALVACCPSWTHDVRGLYWVIKAKRT